MQESDDNKSSSIKSAAVKATEVRTAKAELIV